MSCVGNSLPSPLRANMPWRRAPQRVRRDLSRGYYTPEQARERFFVCVDPLTREVDARATAPLRGERAARGDPQP